MHLAKFATNRLIKIVANAAKGAYLLIHYVRPDARFTIPHYRPAHLRSRKKKRIPRIIWQTNFTDRVTFPVFLNYKFNRLMSLTCEYRFMTDDNCAEFIRTNYPAPVFEAYRSLGIGAARADFWRMLVLMRHGGIYLDMDAHLIWPIEALISRDDGELFVLDRSDKLTNYFVASEEGHPLLARVIEKIMRNIQTAATNDVSVLTGPGAMISAIGGAAANVERYRYVCDQGNFTNEFFQYADHSYGKWFREQQEHEVLRSSDGKREAAAKETIRNDA